MTIIRQIGRRWPAGLGGGQGALRAADGGHRRQTGAAGRRPSARGGIPGCAGIPNLALSVSRVETYLDSHLLGLGSGFFYKTENKTYYITNRHMIIHEPTHYKPDTIKLYLHTDPANISYCKTVYMDLYDADGRPAWREHPKRRKAVDVVAIPASRDCLDGCAIFPLSKDRQVPDEMVLDMGQDLMVVGFPKGLSDGVHNLPIARNASLASSYKVPFNEKPYMLIDSRLHPGTSGSPVFTKPIFTARRPDGTFTTSPGGRTYLVGIHSAELHLQLRNETAENAPMGLNFCWFASLLDDMT